MMKSWTQQLHLQVEVRIHQVTAGAGGEEAAQVQAEAQHVEVLAELEDERLAAVKQVAVVASAVAVAAALHAMRRRRLQRQRRSLASRPGHAPHQRVHRELHRARRIRRAAARAAAAGAIVDAADAVF